VRERKKTLKKRNESKTGLAQGKKNQLSRGKQKIAADPWQPTQIAKRKQKKKNSIAPHLKEKKEAV